jgi:putative ABC transport system substrate-binding protein
VEWLIIHLTEPFISERALVARLALENRIPTIFPSIESVDAGGLMSYGASFRETFERAAYFADRVLRGADPAVLPIEFTNAVELGVNLATARALGISFPSDIVLRADHVVD